GWRAPSAWASPRGPPPRSSWSPRWSRRSSRRAGSPCARFMSSRKTCASGCRESWKTSPVRAARPCLSGAASPRGASSMQLVTFRRGRGEPKVGAVWHEAERGAAVPEHPVYFTKPGTSVVGPGDDVVHHAITTELDYEVELAVVLGTAGRDISRPDALKHVFGYTVINDMTARDLQKRHTQWFKGKSLDTFCPMGPVLVTADEIPDPQALSISMRVNGQVRQSSHTSKMIFPVDQCIEVLSRGMTVLPGDIIATGTPG